ncbi:TRAP transporter small permease subunit [Ideonella sp. DXS22W]|uniref:TRAP transporter small permease protein n=1 Tax=Pseudaquabacterium inlustre TaxID=2984192 RepID=A0ABU9CAS6_9BURK
MTPLLPLSRAIDKLNEWVGSAVSWLVLAAVLISAGNAIVRKAFNNSSNGLLEIQWYLFAAVFLLAAGYTMLRQEHVKIDVILGKFSRRTQVKVEIFGIVAFLFPFCWKVITLVWPLVVQAYNTGEMSSNAGGLIRWPVYALVPAGFALLWLQGVSELIKRLGFLAGVCDDPAVKKDAKSAEEELAEIIRARAEAEAAEKAAKGAQA